MKTVNMHEAKTQFSKLVDEAVNGSPFVVAKAGKPMVLVTKVDVPQKKLLGFLEGQGTVPDDFNTMFADEIAAMFEGTE